MTSSCAPQSLIAMVFGIVSIIGATAVLAGIIGYFWGKKSSQ